MTSKNFGRAHYYPAAIPLQKSHDVERNNDRYIRLKKSAGCSKMPGCKARNIRRNEAYFSVRRKDE